MKPIVSIMKFIITFIFSLYTFFIYSRTHTREDLGGFKLPPALSNVTLA